MNAFIPLVSIIIPNYNKAHYILETLNSIRSQSYSKWEAVVVDDGSTDGSQEIINEIASIENRIIYIPRTGSKKGGSVCRNIGISQARGKYLMLFDSDDLMMPNCIEERVNYLEIHQDLDFAVFSVGTFHKTIGDNAMVWQPKIGNHLVQFLKHELPWNIMSPIWRTSFVKKIGGFDEAFPRLQDVEFHTRSLIEQDVNYQIVKHVAPACYYRIDQQRTAQSYIQRLTTMQKGVELYIYKFEKLIQDKKMRKNLQGTLFSFLTQVNYYRTKGWISNDEYQMLLLDITELLESTSFFSRQIQQYLNIYNRLYQIGFWKIKGFNLFSRMIITS